MIACPNCGEDTVVRETRSVHGYARRRRQCPKSACGAKLTTYEIVVAADQPMPSNTMGDVIMVSRRDVEAMLRVAATALALRHGEDAVTETLRSILPSTKGTTDGNRGTDDGRSEREVEPGTDG